MSSDPTARHIVDEPNRGRIEFWPIATDEQTLWTLIQELFDRHWDQIQFGPLVPGAAWEIRAPCKPVSTALLDGYVTVNFGAWHFHLCISEFKGIAPELARLRRTGRAEFYRALKANDTPASWGIRFYTVAGDQQMTVFLPNPFLDNDRVTATPNWSRLALWDNLRRKYLDLDADLVDRTGTGFGNG